MSVKQFIAAKRIYLEQLGFIDQAHKIAELGDISKVKSFWQYDDRVVAKLHQFKDVHDYYQQSSSRQFLTLVKVPTRHSAPLGHLIDIQSYIFLLNSNIIFN